MGGPSGLMPPSFRPPAYPSPLLPAPRLPTAYSRPTSVSSVTSGGHANRTGV